MRAGAPHCHHGSIFTHVMGGRARGAQLNLSREEAKTFEFVVVRCSPVVSAVALSCGSAGAGAGVGAGGGGGVGASEPPTRVFAPRAFDRVCDVVARFRDDNGVIFAFRPRAASDRKPKFKALLRGPPPAAATARVAFAASAVGGRLSVAGGRPREYFDDVSPAKLASEYGALCREHAFTAGRRFGALDYILSTAPEHSEWVQCEVSLCNDVLWYGPLRGSPAGCITFDETTHTYLVRLSCCAGGRGGGGACPESTRRARRLPGSANSRCTAGTECTHCVPHHATRLAGAATGAGCVRVRVDV